MQITIHTDGGARGNPGPAAVGVVIEITNSKRKIEFGKKIGESTNNVAEYTAVVEALKRIKQEKIYLIKEEKEKVIIQFFLDSMLVVNQLNGLFKVKDANLRILLTSVRVLEQEVEGEVKYQYVPREQNRRADFLVNQALDEINA